MTELDITSPASKDAVISERDWLLADKATVEHLLAGTPEKARLTRMSFQARLRNIEAMLAQLPPDPET